MSLIANTSKPVNNTTTTTTKVTKVPTLRYFFGESGYNIAVLDSLAATGMVTKDNLTAVLKRKDILLTECKGNSLVISTVASNGLIKNIGYFSSNDGRELFKEDIVEGYKVIQKNTNNLILAVSNEDFIASWTV